MTGHLVHEWLARDGGSENVVAVLAETFPDATISSLWEDGPSRFAAGRVRESILARTPLRRSKALALPVMPLVWRHLPPVEAEWVLCSSHLFAHHARFRGSPHIDKYVYAHTPARYLWNPELDPRGAAAPVRAAARALKPLDRARSAEATSIAANSAYVSRRVQEAWRRDSIVIHPPVDVEFFAGEGDLSQPEEELLARLPDRFLLGASRFVRYKRLDDVIAAGEAADVPVVLAGDGPDESRLQSLASAAAVPVHFTGRPSRAMLRALYRSALAFVFTAVEDFGIMPVEAMAAGTPVIANVLGGSAESVVHGTTGALLDRIDRQSLRQAVTDTDAMSTVDCRRRAAQFDVPRFQAAVLAWIGRS